MSRSSVKSLYAVGQFIDAEWSFACAGQNVAQLTAQSMTVLCWLETILKSHVQQLNRGEPTGQGPKSCIKENSILYVRMRIPTQQWLPT